MRRSGAGPRRRGGCGYPLGAVQVDPGVEQLVVVIVFELPLLDDGAEVRSETHEP